MALVQCGCFPAIYLYTTVFALTMAFAGKLQDKYGPRPVASAGGIILGAALTLCSFAHSPLMMVLTYGLTGIGNGLCFSTTIPSTIKWFPANKQGLITGMVVGGGGLAATYFAPLANWLLVHYDISHTFLILGIMNCLILTGFAQFLANPPAGQNRGQASHRLELTTNAPVTSEFLRREMLKTAAFKKLWFIYFCTASAGLMIMAHIATIARTQANWENGFYLVMVFAIFNTVGRLASGYSSDKFGRINIIILIVIIQAVNLLLFASYNSPLLLVVGAILTGLAYGSCFSLFPLATADLFGMKNFGGNYGLMFTAWGAAGLLGPVFAGWIVDVSGTYVIAYIAAAALLLTALMLSFTLRPLKAAKLKTERLPL
jgi:MFS transporter, OFA family, oxalate/formate antiporter